jgi:hypothetical protein
MRIIIGITLLILIASCSKKDNSEESTAPTSADRTKFIGTWAGSYSCPSGTPNSDTLVILIGSGTLDFRIIIHKGTFNPDTVSGSLTESNIITVSQQTMGGFPGTAKITYQSGLLIYNQIGFGITCGGTNYTKVP